LDNYRKIIPPIPNEPKRPIKKYPHDTRKPFFSTSVYIIILLIIVTIIAPDTALYTFYGMLVLGVYKYISHNKQQNLYYKLLREEEQNYSIQLKEYSEERNKWLTQKRHVERLIEISKENIDPILSRKNFLNELVNFKQISLKETSFNESGTSEMSFYVDLFKEFNDKILHNKSVFVSNHNSSYTPDFIYRNEEIFIDIEIDEPYTLEERKPIHYEFNDDNRDNFFLDINWAIVRFSERQIVNEPHNCIETIKSVLSIMEGETNELNTYDLKDSVWSKEDAINMANNFEREKYLNINPIIIKKPMPPKPIFTEDDLPF